MRARFCLAFAPLLALVCSKGEVGEKPSIAIEPPDTLITIPQNALQEGQVWERKITVSNANPGTSLVISQISGNEQKCKDDPTSAFSFEILRGDKPVTLPATIRDTEVTSPEGPISIKVQFKRPKLLCERKYVLAIKSNTSEVEKQTLEITFVAPLPQPHIVIAPNPLDLGLVLEGETSEGEFIIQNTGTGDLHISNISYYATEPLGFAFEWGCLDSKSNQVVKKWVQITDNPKTLKEAACAGAETIASNSEERFKVRYGAQNDHQAKAFLTFSSDDPEKPQYQLEIKANFGGPCLTAIPSVVDFGAVELGGFKFMTVELFGCGDQEVQVSKIVLQKGNASPFTLDLEPLGSFSEQNPLVVSPSQRRPFNVLFTPPAEGEFEDKIIITNTSPRPSLEISVHAMAVKATKPVAEFKMFSTKNLGQEIKDGDKVMVLDTIRFQDESYDPSLGGKIVRWEWQVRLPPGSADYFKPTNTFQNPFFDVNVIGDYVFGLKVFNKAGVASDLVEKTVHVIAGEGCVVELTWHTPSDPDESDECQGCGADLDLHVVHPLAGGPDADGDGKPDGFCDEKGYDCYWANAHPHNWVPEGDPALDNPSLDRDDTNGAGPENFRYPRPEQGKCYKVGVHYWDDHGFGASYATIRVYINGEKKYERSNVRMVMSDMWEVGEVCCTNENFPFVQSDKAGGPLIIPQYNNSNCLHLPE
jgi:hypothetical protein